VLTEERLRWLSKLDGNKLEATLLKATNDGRNKTTLNAVGLSLVLQRERANRWFRQSKVAKTA
jgi:hypothetical protein